MTEQQIVNLVRRYLQDHQPAGIALEVLEPSVHKDGDWWYVPVRPCQQLPKTYQYYEELTDIEDELKDKEHIDVLLVPA
jgi:hypothetical protein